MSLLMNLKINENSVAAMLDLAMFSNQLADKSKRNIEREGFNFVLNNLIENSSQLLAYTDSGKPYLKGRKEHISLSHSHDKLVVVLNNIESTGVDIELIRDKVLLVRHKFLSEEELNSLSELDVEKNLVYWAAKETLYKIQGKKGVNFTTDLFIWDFDYNTNGGVIRGNILNNESCNTYALKYSKQQEYILVYMLNEICNNL